MSSFLMSFECILSIGYLVFCQGVLIGLYVVLYVLLYRSRGMNGSEIYEGMKCGIGMFYRIANEEVVVIGVVFRGGYKVFRQENCVLVK